MNKNDKNLLFNTIAVLLFVGLLVSTIWTFWSAIGDSVLNVGGKLGLSLEIPNSYYILSCVFAVALVLFVVLSYVFKNTILVMLPLVYQLLTIFSVILLAILATDLNNSAYIIYIITFSLFAPLYGFCEITYVWSLFLILPLFFASIIVTYKVFIFKKAAKLKK